MKQQKLLHTESQYYQWVIKYTNKAHNKGYLVYILSYVLLIKVAVKI